MAREHRLIARVSVAWWIHPWLLGLRLTALMTGATPDPVKVQAMVARAVRIRFEVASHQ